MRKYLFILLFFSLKLSATDYYVSSTGDDGANGLWFDALGQQNPVTVAQLIAADYRTLVHYANEAPFDVYKIGLLKKTHIETAGEHDTLSRDFWLWVFRYGYWNDYGYLKDNRQLP